MASDWNCVNRYYRLERRYLPVQQVSAQDHPLRCKSIINQRLEGAGGGGGGQRYTLTSGQSLVADPLLLTLSLDGTDPLSQFVRQDQQDNEDASPPPNMDPLSQMASEYKRSSNRNNEGDSSSASQDEMDLNWRTKRLSILNKYTTSEKLSITTSFLSTGKGHGATSDTLKVQTVVADKVKYRLEQLDDFEEDDVRQMLDLTQQEYIQRIQELNQELVQSWHNDQRVKALKIAIQCSKILTDTSVLPFYPSQFVLITDILDIFGHLVYERLKQKADQGKGTSLAKASEENTRSTCQNWFFKVASIRELLPRLYIEMSILKCYEFLRKSSHEKVFQRLSLMIRGIGNPLVAIYCRCYLIRKATTVMSLSNIPQPLTKDLIYQNVQDIFNVHHTIFSNAIQNDLKMQQIQMNRYMSLYEPALQFILQALFHMNQLHHQDVLQQIKTLKNSGILLMAVLMVCPPEVIAVHAMDILDIILSLPPGYDVGVSQANLLRSFGVKISSSGHSNSSASSATSSLPPLNENRTLFLRNVFELIGSIQDGNEYLSCVEPWSEFIAKHFPMTEVNRYLNEINQRLSSHKLCPRHCQLLYNIFDKILQHQRNIELLLTQESFLPFMDLIQVDDIRQQACKQILMVYKQNSNEFDDVALDAVTINALMHISKILSNSVNALTLEDERRHISQLICYFIRKVDFGQDVERQLSFYAEVRETFTDLDAVYCTVVQAVNKLAMSHRCSVKLKRNGANDEQDEETLISERKAFVKACIAFCYITIPSLNSIHQRLDLYLLSGQVALIHQCLGQADGCFEAALQLLEEMEEITPAMSSQQLSEAYVAGFLCNLLAILELVPDSPEQGVLHLLRRVLTLIPLLPFTISSKNGSTSLTIYLRALDLLYIQSLEEFPHSLKEVVSNDVLYGQDPKFLAEINNICIQVIERILEQLRQLGLQQQHRWQALGSLELLERVVRYADLSREKTFQLCVNLWSLARKHESLLPVNYLVLTIKTLKNIESGVNRGESSARTQGEHLTRLILRLQG